MGFSKNFEKKKNWYFICKMTSLAARHSVQRVEREIIYLLICLFKHLLKIRGPFLQKSR